MAAYPLIVLIVSAVFGAAVFRQYRRRHRQYQLIWSFSLLMAALGSLAYIVFLLGGKSELAFRVYYICGALLTAPLLGMGSLLLAARSDPAQRRMQWVLRTLIVLGAIGALLLLVSPIDGVALQHVNGGPGDRPDTAVAGHPDVYRTGIWLLFLIVLNIFGAAAVIGVALYSGWQLWKRRIAGRLVAANALIALGTYVISQAGGQARTGLGAGFFWVTMAIGWVVLFCGFLLTSRGQREPATQAQGSAATLQPRTRPS